MHPKIPVTEPECLTVAVNANAKRFESVNGFFFWIESGLELWVPHIEGKNGYTDGICFDLLTFARENGYEFIVFTTYRKRGSEYFARFVEPGAVQEVGRINKVRV